MEITNTIITCLFVCILGELKAFPVVGFGAGKDVFEYKFSGSPHLFLLLKMYVMNLKSAGSANFQFIQFHGVKM